MVFNGLQKFLILSMKRFTLIAIAIACMTAFGVQAKDGYKIQLKFPDLKDTLVYLGHYYGKAGTIYKTDSVMLDQKGMGTMQSNTKVLGGIYIILLSDKKTYFEFLLDNGYDLTISGLSKDFPDGLTYKGSKENDDYVGYVKFLKGFGEKQQLFSGELANAANNIDSTAVREKIRVHFKSLYNYRRDFAKQHPGHLLAKIFMAMDEPEIPEGPHYKADGKTIDSMYSYNYYKDHYWDGFDFQDDRLVHTPVYDTKLEGYFNRTNLFGIPLTLPIPDSVIKEGKKLLTKTEGTKELYKYSLFWLVKNAESSNVMGMDEAYIYFVEDYIMRGKADWLDAEGVEKYRKDIEKKKPNVIGNVAPEIIMQDYMTGKDVPLSSVKSKYTLLVFWDPTCGHCTTEIPKMDSVYKAVLKDKGVKVYSVRTEGPVEKWQEFIKKNGLEDWYNVHDPEHHSNYRAQYNVYSTPVMYLLDEKKIIRGKRFDHTNVMEVIKMIEAQDKEKKGNK